MFITIRVTKYFKAYSNMYDAIESLLFLYQQISTVRLVHIYMVIRCISKSQLNT